MDDVYPSSVAARGDAFVGIRSGACACPVVWG